MEKTYGSIGLQLSPGGDTQDTFEEETPKDSNQNGSSVSLSASEISPMVANSFDNKSVKGNRPQSQTMHWLFCNAIIVLILTWFAISFFSSDPSTSGSIEGEEEYEYIIVGAGPAGLVAAVNIAKRLKKEAQDSNSLPGKVLLLESGTKSQSDVMRKLNSQRHLGNNSMRTSGLPPNGFDIPLMWSSLSRKDNGDKGISDFYSHHWPVEILGRAIGGSGIHNAMINVRALPNDFDRWNVTNFSAEDMMPYFNRLESYDASIPVPDFWADGPPLSKRGSDGPLNTIVGDAVTSPIARDFISSSLAAGLPLASLGFNEPDTEKRIGVGYYEFNIRNGIRDSAARAFLSPGDRNAEVPENLIIRTDATVEKVLFDTCTNNSVDEGNDNPCEPKSVGVRYFSSKNGTFKEVRLRHVPTTTLQETKQRVPEIILAAGTILTPQILANSGIHENGTVVDSKNVGSNVQDHPVVGVVFHTKENMTESIGSYFNLDKDSTKTFESYLDSIKYSQSTGRRVEMSKNAKVYGTPGFAVGAFLRSPSSHKSDASSASRGRAPDIQLTFFPHTIEPHFIQRHNLTSGPKIHSILVTVALLKPEATYKLDLYHPSGKLDRPGTKSVETPRTQFEKMFQFHVPDIQGGTLSGRDLQRLAWGVNQVRNIMSVPPLSNNIDTEQMPGAQYQNRMLENFIDRHIMRNSHWAGSTRMGNDDDKNSVVDSKLRVRGVKDLRIVDAGIMPFIPNGNTHSTTCALALRGVDLIFG